MSDELPHDLHDFMQQMSVEIASEYRRLRRRAAEDPGTAGDQGEENWANVLKQWLPGSYYVVTKGRIINEKGQTSKQVDVIVLSAAYPKRLLTKKLYLAAGVVAAFECKTTLKSSHIAEAAACCATIKGLFSARTGTPYRELHSPPVFGVLAHSHSWKALDSTPRENIERALTDSDASHASHPRLRMDLLCVADLGLWSSFAVAFVGPAQLPGWGKASEVFGPTGSASTAFMGHLLDAGEQERGFTPVGAMISTVTRKLAWADPSLQPLADYYRLTRVDGSGRGNIRSWPSSIYSDAIRARVEAGMLSNGVAWDEWSVAFH